MYRFRCLVSGKNLVYSRGNLSSGRRCCIGMIELLKCHAIHNLIVIVPVHENQLASMVILEVGQFLMQAVGTAMAALSRRTSVS